MIELLDEPSTELTVQDRASIALASSKTRQDLMMLATKYASITEIKNVAGRYECHSAAMTLASARSAISKTGKSARDDATKFSKAVIAEEASLIEITAPEEKRLLALRDEWDATVAAEKAARELAEKARIMVITDRIASIRQYVELAASCRTAARIHELQGKLARTSLEGFEEFADEAAVAHADAMKRVEALLVEKHLQEQEQDRIKAEQAAAAAKLATERAEFEEAQAAAKAEADRLASERHAELKASMAEAARMDADRLAKIANEVREQAAQRAAAQAVIDAQQAELARQRAEFEDQVREANRAAAQVRADLEELVREETQAAEQAQKAIESAQEALSEVCAPEAPDCCAPDGLCTDACSNSPALTGPTDSEVAWVAASEVADTFNLTLEQATERLAAIRDWKL